jgi:hypothetical protein
MKKLMLLALIAGASSVYAADAAAGKPAEGEMKRDANGREQGPAVELGHAPADRNDDAGVKAKKAERAARKAAQNAEDNMDAGAFNEPANYGRDAQAVKAKAGFAKFRHNFANWRGKHPRIFFGGLTVVGLGIVGWIVNKFVVSKKATKPAVVTSEFIKAQEQVTSQFKPAVKA